VKTLLVCAILLVTAPLIWGATATFDSDVAGKPPTGWTCGATGKGNPKWAIEPDSSAPSSPNVLEQAGNATFPWCVKEETDAADGSVNVKFKPVGGREDQAGGVVWRWKDGNNYYVARANALEGNVSLYYMANGRRHTIKYVNAPVALKRWHSLQVTYQGDTIRVSLDGTLYIEAKDSHIRGAGKSGVWTKADSVTLFDDFNTNAAP
jgi:hypothetical protein